MDSAAPQFPTRLPGELWGVTAYFNPARYANKLRNLRRFAESARQQGLKLLIVELAFGRTPFEVPEELCDALERRRGADVLWQKERLLNIGVRQLPASCDKVVLLDCDILFENDRWVDETAALLESYCAVQPFDTACWLPHGVRSAPQRYFSFGNHDGGSLPSMAYAMSRAEDRRHALGHYQRSGHLGFAWALRRRIVEKHGLYDCQILGSGDFDLGHALFGDEDYWNGQNWMCGRLSAKLLAHIASWSRRLYEDVRCSVYYVPGRVLHLWHGSQRDRQYCERLDLLRICDFDPEVDLKLNEEECWIWASDKPRLRRWAEEYYRSRREE